MQRGIREPHPKFQRCQFQASLHTIQSMTPEQRETRLAEARDDEGSWLEWYRLTPLERWEESKKLWQFYLRVGGALDPEPDHQSPFDAFMPRSTPSADGGAGLRVLRRGRV